MSVPIAPEFLKSLAFLAPATEEDLRQLATAARSEAYPAGTVLFREGDRLLHFWIVVSGNVAIEIAGPDRRPRRIHTVGAGELLGWTPVLGPSPMTATGRALTEVQTVAIDTQALLAVCAADPQFGFRFMRRVAAAIATRLNSTRLQLLDVFGTEIPTVPSGAAGGKP